MCSFRFHPMVGHEGRRLKDWDECWEPKKVKEVMLGLWALDPRAGENCMFMRFLYTVHALRFSRREYTSEWKWSIFWDSKLSDEKTSKGQKKLKENFLFWLSVLWQFSHFFIPWYFLQHEIVREESQYYSKKQASGNHFFDTVDYLL